MSAGSFEQSNDGSRRRIAHAGAGSSDLLASLNYKKESMGKLLNNVKRNPTMSTKEVFPVFKRQKLTSDCENDKAKVATRNHLKTFCGKGFMNAVSASMYQKKETRMAIHSDEEDSDPNWLSKSKVFNGMSAISGKPLPSKPPNSQFKVKQRAILSSDEDEANEKPHFQIGDSLKKHKAGFSKLHKNSQPSNSKAKSKRKRADDDFVFKRKSSRKHNFSTGSEECEDEDGGSITDEEEIADTPSSSELSDGENELNPKKSLKELTAKAKKVRAKQKRRGETHDLMDGSEDDQDDEAANEAAGSNYNSDDSDAAERDNKRTARQRRILEERCLEFVNGATEEELVKTEKFNERFAKSLVEKRPFNTYAHMAEQCTSFTRGVAMLESYIEFLENRSILDQVLDDCKKQSEGIKTELKRLENDDFSTQPALLNSSCVLHPYQQVGLQWLIMMNRLGLNSILADEMGLGKTIQIIAFLAWMKEQRTIQFPHLIVVPASTLENWMNEIAKWCPTLRLLTYYGSIQDRAHLRYRASSKNVDVILTTYNMIISRPEDRSFFKKFSINYVIYDEGHMLRSCNTMRYKNLMRVRGKRKILLTGTPLQNNLVELISLLFFTMTKLFTKYCDDITVLLQMFARKGGALATTSEKRYTGATSAKRGRKPASKNVEENEDQICEEENDISGRPLYETHKIIQAKSILQPFILRRLKINVLDKLPKKYEQIELCDITDVQDELYNEVLREYHQAKLTGSANALSSMMQMRQVANHPLLYRRIFVDSTVREMARVLCAKESKYKGKKAEHVAEDLAYMTDIQIHLLCKKFASLQPYELETALALESGKCKRLDECLPEIFNKGEKVLIFSQFTTVLDILEMYLELRDFKFCRLDGSTMVMERQDLINQFNQDPSIKVFLLSTKAGGLGINLTAANNIIIHDIDINPYNDKQAEDRCHRMGQTREVHVTRLISRNTIEESMLGLAQKKLELEKHVTSGHGKGQKEELDSKTVEEFLMRAIEQRRV